MSDKVDELKKLFESRLEESKTSEDIEHLKVEFLGRKGPVVALMQEMRNLSPEDRPIFGKKVNILKTSMQEACVERSALFVQEEMNRRLEEEKIDVTLPSRPSNLGSKHIITKTLERVCEVLGDLGFSIQYGPDVDSEYYNFEALNFEDDHPARDMQDTYYIEPGVLLRTHTSNVQGRVMEKNSPPIRIAAPGKCYRNESITARSHVFFHQVEVLYVAEKVSFMDLMDTMKTFFRRFFQKDVQMRFRPSYFPFVEPGMEVDVQCHVCSAKGCNICKYTSWLEVAGAGMVHPNVLAASGIDPEKYTGFAWGMGIERLVMMQYGIKDIRLFTENDQRFLKDFVTV